jgi:hypothetical protein
MISVELGLAAPDGVYCEDGGLRDGPDGVAVPDGYAWLAQSQFQ